MITLTKADARAALIAELRESDNDTEYVNPISNERRLTLAWRAADMLAADSPEQEKAMEPCPTCGETEPFTGTCGTSNNDIKALCRRVDMLAADAPEQEPVAWGHPKDVGHFIRQLQTFDPSTPIHGAMFTEYKGRTTAFIKGLTVSRERVDGRFIKQGDETVPYSLVVWTNDDKRSAPQALELSDEQIMDVSGEFVRDALGKTNLLQFARAVLAARSEP